jgi:hypothetical protein
MVSLNERARADGWDGFWGCLNHQGDFYDSTVAAMPFLIEALAHSDVPCRTSILDRLRQRWLDAPEYGGDPLVPDPPGGIDEPTPMRTDLGAKDEDIEEPDDEGPDGQEDFDISAYRRMDLCAWQTGRAIQAGQQTYIAILEDPERAVATSSAKLLLLWPETRQLAKQRLIQAFDDESDPVQQGDWILEFGAYAGEGPAHT